MSLSSCLASCNDYGKRLPKGEECIVTTYGAFCVNTVDNSEYDRIFDELYTYSCVSPSRKKDLENYIFGLMRELDCFRAGGKECQRH